MTWFTDEQSVHDAEPVELYEFTTPTQTFRLTSYTQNVLFQSNTFTRTAIRRGKIEQASGSERPALTVELDVSESLGQLLASDIPEHAIRLRLYRYHPTSATSAVIWEGPVVAASVKGSVVSMSIPSLLVDAIRTAVPRLVVQRHCNHILYDQFCGLDSSGFDQLVQVTAISADGLTITTNGTPGLADVYKGGEMVTGPGERRLILSYTTGNVHTINLPFRSIAVNDFVTRFLGCDHTIETCKTKFANEANFGGHAFVPTKNLFRTFGGIRGGGISE